MARNWTPIAAFFLGVTLTVGVYESLRLARNTARAWKIASHQMAGEDVPTPSDEVREAALGPATATGEKRRARRRAGARQPAAAPASDTPTPQAPMRVMTDPAQALLPPHMRAPAPARPSQADRRRALRERLASMSPEEREALVERRRERRDRQRERLEVLRDLRDQGVEGDPGLAPGEPLEGELALDTGLDLP